MIRIAALGVVVLICSSTAAPDYGGGNQGYIKIDLAPSYGAPPKEQECYPKQVTKIMTKDVQETKQDYATMTREVPTTLYAYITETVVKPKTIIQYSTMTAYAEPRILTKSKILYDTKMVTVPIYMTDSAYGYNTANKYFTETEAVYATKTVTESYPLSHTVTKTSFETKGFYVTQTKVQNSYVTVTVKNPYYVTKYATEYDEQVNYHTVTETENAYVTMTVFEKIPEYHTVTKCAQKTTKMYGY